MKNLALLVSLAIMAVPSFSEAGLQDYFNVHLDGLFGYKFGDRVPSTMAVIPSGDGLLLAQAEPKEPEFAFQEYFVIILPQTRVVVGFCAANTYKDDERERCDNAYSRYQTAVQSRFKKKMTTIPPTESGTGDSQSVIKNCIVELADSRFVMLQMLKNNPGGYLLRLTAVDAKRARGPVKQHERRVESVTPLDGLFGRKLGEKVPVSDDETTVANGLCLQVFSPPKQFLDFNIYVLQILPQSRKTLGIVAIKEYTERFPATECYAKVCQLLERKFGLKMTDASSNFDATKPDADGELMIKVAVMSFPNSLRFIEVHCLKDIDDNVFRVRILATDQALANALEAEKKALDLEKSDAKALDAL